MMKESYLDIVSPLMNKGSLDKLQALENPVLHAFVAKAAGLCRPDHILVCNDSVEDRETIRQLALQQGEEIALARPGHTVHFDAFKDCRLHDQSRDKAHTRYLMASGQNLGPGIATLDREEGLTEMSGLLDGIMAGKTMLVRFFCLGPTQSVFSIPCVQITDSAYVAHSEDLLFRPGYEEFKQLGTSDRFFRMLHAAGRLEHHVCADLVRRRIYIDLEEDLVYSVNTQYAGNSVGLKKLALRLAIRKADQEGWLAEHMFVMGVHGLHGRKAWFTGAYPSACGKTSTSMLPGESIVGDDLAYLRVCENDVRAVNVEHGIFGIIENVNPIDDPELFRVLHEAKEAIFSNVLVHDNQPYWLGMGQDLPKTGVNYAGNWCEGKADSCGQIIAPSYRGNARFAVRLDELRNLDPRADDPEGVPVSGIIYGGRDSQTSVPVLESFDWTHGVVTMGASLESETTAAAMGAEGVRAFNPMANLDFLSIPLERYVSNHLAFGCKVARPPRIFSTNYWLRDAHGVFLNAKHDKAIWIKWMERRIHGDVGVVAGPTGFMPRYDDLRKLFREVLGSSYIVEDYQQQFCMKIPLELARIERVKGYLSQAPDMPAVVFYMLEGQRRRLVRWQHQVGDLVTPFDLEQATTV
jgi:phosphoenolpyruvate carboxykinase (GTP)